MNTLRHNPPRPKRHCLAVLIASSLLSSFVSHADEFSQPQLKHSQSDFGGVGLMQMPSARMMEEGQLDFSASYTDEYLHYTAALQLFPWLETTIRYTQVQDVLYNNNEDFSGDTKYTDKSIDAKVRLWQESYWLPQVSLGFRDIGGTGLFDGEYLVASKRYGPLDFTLGIGWGYLANRGNLSGDKSNSYDCGRDSSYDGGVIEVGRMFTGCSSVFGGVEYQTPFEPLRLKLEYDANDYLSDRPVLKGKVSMPVSTPWNVGVVYALADWADLRLSYERGNTFTAGLTLGTNIGEMAPTWVDTPAPAYKPKTLRTDLSDEEWRKLSQDLNQIAGYEENAVYYRDGVVYIEGEQTKYRDRKEAEKRAVTLLANSGLKASQYRIVETAQFQALTETQIDSAAFAKVAQHQYPDASIEDARSVHDPLPTTGEKRVESRSAWDFGVAPVLQQSFGGAEDFYLYAIGVSANASYRLGRHWLASGSLYANITDNYDKFNYTVPPDGTDLKRVRTLNRQYYEDPVRIDHLQLTYFDALASGWYTQAYVGYLETMFAGAGTELLYRPLASNWAFGLDVNYVKQRDPDSILGLYQQELHYDPQTERDYRVQTGAVTGHATMYWQPQFWSMLDNTLLKVSAGRYLTEDVGVTIDFSKQFDSGVIAGAFVTKTDLSAEEFGEGSYSKGFYISIPIDLLTVKPSTNRVGVSWLPLQRDGGQMLNRRYSLYGMTDARSPWFTRESSTD
ncbi:YjbH domain-containing protein [Vibrio sp. NTOU-M3]|uniref:YjbH domain-containing protein n=1 Tax=Vibrio sp. NTOU-M3 TaxID=3234954 RepID=UPI00349F0D67